MMSAVSVENASRRNRSWGFSEAVLGISGTKCRKLGTKFDSKLSRHNANTSFASKSALSTGTIAATTRPHVILTSNGTRDLSDALRRRCLYAYVDYPDRDTELAILRTRNPAIEAKLSEQIIGFVQTLRKEDLEKVPGIAETLDFAAALKARASSVKVSSVWVE